MFVYRPYPLLRSGHLQTIVGSLAHGNGPQYRATRFTIELRDGESLVVHEEINSALNEEAPIAILIHGLGGCHGSPYLRRIAQQLGQSPIRCWRVDLRGSGDGIRYAYRPAHAGSSEDVAAVVAHAQARFPQAPILMAGFSLGGGIMLKMLGEAATGCLKASIELASIELALAIAPPIDLETCAANMERWSRRIYTRYYLTMLAKQVVARSYLWPQWQSIPRRPAVRTIRQFDARYTVPLGGFDSIEHYYSTASSGPWLGKITTPTRLLVDRHDPIIPVSTFKSTPRSPQVDLEFTSFGGHLGYVGRNQRGQLVRWMDYWVVEQLIGHWQKTHGFLNAPRLRGAPANGNGITT